MMKGEIIVNPFTPLSTTLHGCTEVLVEEGMIFFVHDGKHNILSGSFWFTQDGE